MKLPAIVTMQHSRPGVCRDCRKQCSHKARETVLHVHTVQPSAAHTRGVLHSGSLWDRILLSDPPFDRQMEAVDEH